jgi:phosphoglycerate dehydrogenase-like enzyme
MPDSLRVTIALPLEPALLDAIRAVSDRILLTHLTRTQRLVYRDGRPLWAGYHEPVGADDEGEDEARAALAPILRETEVLLTNPIVPDAILDRAPALSWLQLTSAGVDRLLNSDVVRLGQVKVTTASGLHAVPISEYVIGAILAFAKGLPKAQRAQQEHVWRPYWPRELEGATIGIVGLGAIGGRVAELARALGMCVLGVRRSCPRRMTGAEAGEPSVDELLSPADLDYVLSESDYLVLAVPLTDESRHMIGEAQLRLMKPTAVIVNIARGAVIDQDALISALKEDRLGGAALDVTEPEPLPPDSELWTLDNALITPHISGGTPRYMERAIDIFCDNLRRYLAGEPLRNVVDPARGY